MHYHQHSYSNDLAGQTDEKQLTNKDVKPLPHDEPANEVAAAANGTWQTIEPRERWCLGPPKVPTEIINVVELRNAKQATVGAVQSLKDEVGIPVTWRTDKIMVRRQTK